MNVEILRALIKKWRDDCHENRAGYPEGPEGLQQAARDGGEQAAKLSCANDLEQLLDILG